MATKIGNDGNYKKMMKKTSLTSKIESELELLERHVTMLKTIMESEPIGIIKLSELLNYPQHKVRYSLRILESEGLIEPSPEGAMTTKKLPIFLDRLKKILKSMGDLIDDLSASIAEDK